MNRNKIVILNDLIQDLKKYSSSICVSLATQVRDEMYDCAKYAINEFYNDYKPLYYKRHYKNFKKNSFRKYYYNPHNSIIRGGVELTPNELNDIYRADKNYVFNLVYSGFHGNVSMFPFTVGTVPPIMNPSPLEILLDKRDCLINNIEDYLDVAYEKANKQAYAFISF